MSWCSSQLLVLRAHDPDNLNRVGQAFQQVHERNDLVSLKLQLRLLHWGRQHTLVWSEEDLQGGRNAWTADGSKSPANAFAQQHRPSFKPCEHMVVRTLS